jgi:hypothetical protein
MRADKIEGHKHSRHVSGPALFGYRFAGSGKLEPVKEQATVVRSIFKLARESAGPAGSPAVSTTAESPSHEGKDWNRQTATNILRNPSTPASYTASNQRNPGSSAGSCGKQPTSSESVQALAPSAKRFATFVSGTRSIPCFSSSVLITALPQQN